MGFISATLKIVIWLVLTSFFPFQAADSTPDHPQGEILDTLCEMVPRNKLMELVERLTLRESIKEL